MNNNIQILLSQVTEVFNIPDWSIYHRPSTLNLDFDECDPLICLAKRIRIEDTTDLGHFAYSTNSFDIQELETYKKAVASDQAEEWAEAMQQEIQSLIDHQTWELIPKQNVQLGHRPLKEKWVYKIKQGVNNQITRFKAR